MKGATPLPTQAGRVRRRGRTRGLPVDPVGVGVEVLGRVQREPELEQDAAAARGGGAVQPAAGGGRRTRTDRGGRLHRQVKVVEDPGAALEQARPGGVF